MAVHIEDLIPDFEVKKLDYDEDTWVRIAFMGTDEMETALSEKMRTKSFRGTASLEGEALTIATCEYIAENVLLAMGGFMRDGKVMEDTYENRYWLLKNVKPVRDWVWRQASSVENFKNKAEDIKNLKSGESVN